MRPRPTVLAAVLVAAWLTAASATAAPTDVDHATGVQPILDRLCIKCHQPRGERAPKAGLDLTNAAGLLAGGRSGAAVVPGDPDASLLMSLVSLPDGDPDRMPPKGHRVSDEELELLRAWIAAGCEAADGARDGAPDADAVPEPELLQLWRAIGSTRPPLSAQALAEAGEAVRIEPVFPGSSLLRVGWPTGQARVTDADVAALARYANHITVLDLGRTGITDASLERTVLRMPMMTRLDLSRTKVTSAGMRWLGHLGELRTLVLHGTAIDDEAVPWLRSIPRLRQVHLWDTGVTEAGEQALREDRPELRVHRVLELPPPEPETDEDDDL